MRQPEDARALIVVDVQRGFDDAGYWGRRNNPSCESNVAALIRVWREHERPIVYVRHDSSTVGSPLEAGTRGNDFKDVLEGEPDLIVSKTVHSAFHGSPDLDGWLAARGITGIVVCGIQTNMCCETTARVGSDLGYRLEFALDATHTFDIVERDGTVYPADEIARCTAATLAADFGRVATTADLTG